MVAINMGEAAGSTDCDASATLTSEITAAGGKIKSSGQNDDCLSHGGYRKRRSACRHRRNVVDSQWEQN